MQLMRQFFTQEYGLFLVCVLLFLSNTTRGNSSNDPTGFSSEGIDYFPLDYHHNSATPNFILLKDNNSGKTSSFHKQKTSSDNLMPYHYNLPSGTAQYNNYFNPEMTNGLEDTEGNKGELNRNVWEMRPLTSFDLSSRQDLSDDQSPFYTMSYEGENHSPEPSSIENDLRNIKSKRDGRSYQRAVKVRNGFRGFSRPLDPINYWRKFIQQRDNKRNEREGMTISVTQNLDILRRRLLKEIALRERQRTQKELMMKNKGILGNIGK